MKNQAKGAARKNSNNRVSRQSSKQAQGLNTRNRRRGALVVRSFQFFLRTAVFVFRSIGTLVRNPKIAAGLLAIAVATFGIQMAKNWIVTKESGVFPVQTLVIGGTTDIKTKVSTAAASILRKAKKENWTRAKIVKELERELRSNEAVDGASVRLGFDQFLRISIQTQTPAFVLQLGDKSRKLVGHKARIMKSKIQDDEYRNLLILELPETKQGELSASKNEVNLPWLSKHVWLIKGGTNLLQEKFLLNKILWTQNTGFAVFLTQTSDNSSVQILLGENELGEKLSRIQSVIAKFDDAENFPLTIDMNYSDKAIIRLSESEIESKLRN